MSKKNDRYIVIGVIILFAILLLVDRFYWAQISQWREDQATNIWLGYTAGIGNMPVGLISSQNIPNPNGMILLGFFLSALPNLLSISLFLGIIQISVFTVVGWKSFGGDWQYFFLATIPLLSSVILRSASVELWNNHVLAPVNILFIFWALKYLEKPSLWHLPPITVLILFAPSLYLAGIVNAIVMTLLTLGIMAYKRPQMDNVTMILILILLITSLSIFLTWLPYFQNVNLQQIARYNTTRLGLVGKFQVAWESLIGIPSYAAFYWANRATIVSAFQHSDPQILSLSTQFLLRLVGRSYLLQAVFAFTTFLSMIFATLVKGTSAKSLNLNLNLPVVRIVTLSALFIGLSFTFSVWLGGPVWVKGERPEQVVQLLPVFLLLVFLLPLTVTIAGSTGRIITGISYTSLVLFAVVNLLCGFMIIHDHLHYRGNILSKADVPLINKMAVIDFIANDWKENSNSNVVPVDYDLSGGIWDWVPRFGLKLEPWYPAPMTVGRSFDYELRREYGLTNYQEGIQLRTVGSGRYLVTYAFNDPPQIEGGNITNHIFGRLRVSVVER